jgi:hypothetical protein
MYSYSYRYSQGQWSSIDDPLQGKSLEESGFGSKLLPDIYMCFGTFFYIYPYNPSLLVSNPTEYKFCCVLYVCPVHYGIWVPDLPDLLHFLQSFQISQKDDLMTVIHGILLGERPLSLSFAKG